MQYKSLAVKLWESLVEAGLQPIARRRLKDMEMLARFDLQRAKYHQVCDTLLNSVTGSASDSVGYDWTGWAANVRQSFSNGVPLGFLSHPILAHTMVNARKRGVSITENKLSWIKNVYDEDKIKLILKEDYIGLPTITNMFFMTSANRTHHLCHLALYKKLAGSDFWDCPSIIEWGGGYGDMARIVRRMNPAVTYTIIDLPEMLALQYVYLSSIFGEKEVNMILTHHDNIQSGRINLISSLSLQEHDKLRSEGFLSTWALNESPKSDQLMVLERDFFQATHILMAVMNNENNFIRDQLIVSDDPQDFKTIKYSVNPPSAFSLGKGNEYWFK